MIDGIYIFIEIMCDCILICFNSFNSLDAIDGFDGLHGGDMHNKVNSNDGQYSLYL